MSKFYCNQAGEMTVDGVIDRIGLAAVIVGLGMIVMTIIGDESDDPKPAPAATVTQSN